jgi:hypothetical protein
MSTDLLDRATALLVAAADDVGDVVVVPAGRDAAITRLAEALRARGQRQRQRRALGALAVAAGVVVVLGSAARLARAPQPELLGRVAEAREGLLALRDGRSEALSQGARVAEGTELRTVGSSEARLDFDTGTRVTIGEGARVRLLEQSQRKRFGLEAGTLFAKVAKLQPGERFVVATPDAEVEVRGTAFRVTIVPPSQTCADGSPTRLEVDEGVVVVRQGGGEHRVGAGERWPSCDESGPRVVAAAPPSPAPPSPSTPVVDVASLSVPQVTSVPATVGPEGPRAESAGSHLAEQNDLFDGAMRAKRSGDASGALAQLDRLLATYPGGPLAESAAVERMRLLATSDRARAAAAARDYLRRHPRGFARVEAEGLANSRK